MRVQTFLCCFSIKRGTFISISLDILKVAVAIGLMALAFTNSEHQILKEEKLQNVVGTQGITVPKNSTTNSTSREEEIKN